MALPTKVVHLGDRKDLYKYVISGWQFVWFSPCCPQRDVDPDIRVTNANLALIPNAPGMRALLFAAQGNHRLADVAWPL